MAESVLLVDDHQIIRDGLRSLLENQDLGCQVVGEASNGIDAIRMVRDLAPDLVIIDAEMPKLNGADAVRRIRKRSPTTNIIALSMHGTHHIVRDMFQSGADAYVLKSSAFEEIAAAINSVRKSEPYLSDGIDNISIDALHSSEDGDDERHSPLDLLTSREKEVLKLISEGFTTAAIADELFLGVKTVETHRRNLMRKLNTSSVAELTKISIRENLVHL